jgi:multicomponent Na+:H+ antiporter subunit E
MAADMNLLKRTYYFLIFLGFYLGKLLKANIFIAYDILTPKMMINPGFTRIRLELSSNFGLLLLSNLVSMTPGTLSMDIDRDREYLEVHLLYMDRKEATEQEVVEIMHKIRRITE